VESQPEGLETQANIWQAACMKTQAESQMDASRVFCIVKQRLKAQAARIKVADACRSTAVGQKSSNLGAELQYVFPSIT
jgi:hypothetical protein